MPVRQRLYPTSSSAAVRFPPAPGLTSVYTPTVIAGFFTGGSLAVRGGLRAARNSAIGCAVLLAVIEGVGIGFQRMMAENTRLDAPPAPAAAPASGTVPAAAVGGMLS